jgi:hypothetical protein
MQLVRLKRNIYSDPGHFQNYIMNINIFFISSDPDHYNRKLGTYMSGDPGHILYLETPILFVRVNCSYCMLALYVIFILSLFKERLSLRVGLMASSM